MYLSVSSAGERVERRGSRHPRAVAGSPRGVGMVRIRRELKNHFRWETSHERLDPRTFARPTRRVAVRRELENQVRGPGGRVRRQTRSPTRSARPVAVGGRVQEEFRRVARLRDDGRVLEDGGRDVLGLVEVLLELVGEQRPGLGEGLDE